MINKPRDTIHVMHAILTLERAGAQEVVRTLARHLQEDGCTVSVCAFEDGPMRTDLEELGVHVDLVRRPRYSVVLFPLFLAEMLRVRRDLVHLIDTHHVDVLQTHLLQVLDFLTPGLRRSGCVDVLLWTIHNVEFLPERIRREPLWLHRLKRLGYRFLYRQFLRYADGFVAISDDVRQALLEQVDPSPDKVFTIRNGVDLTPFALPGNKVSLCFQLGVDEHATLIVTVGRLVQAKGHKYLIEALGLVFSRFPDTHLLIAGDGELRAALERQAENLGIAEHVHFLGVREDVASLLAAADLFVLPSLWEGLSIALLEAMAAAKPIVATAAAGTEEVLIPAQTGLVVPPRDSWALAEGIAQMLDSPDQALAMGQAARRHVETRFSAKENAAHHLALYQRLLRQEVGP